MTSWSARSRSSRRGSSKNIFARRALLNSARRTAARESSRKSQQPAKPHECRVCGRCDFVRRAARGLHLMRSTVIHHPLRATISSRHCKNSLTKNRGVITSHHSKRDTDSAEPKNFRDPLLRTERGDCRWRLKNLQKKPRPRNLLQRRSLLPKKQQLNLHRRRRPLLRRRSNGVPVSD